MDDCVELNMVVLINPLWRHFSGGLIFTLYGKIICIHIHIHNIYTSTWVNIVCILSTKYTYIDIWYANLKVILWHLFKKNKLQVSYFTLDSHGAENILSFGWLSEKDITTKLKCHLWLCIGELRELIQVAEISLLAPLHGRQVTIVSLIPVCALALCLMTLSMWHKIAHLERPSALSYTTLIFSDSYAVFK